MSWMDPKTDPKLQQRHLRSWGKMVTKQRVGLVLGPLLFVIFLIVPEPQSMIDAVQDMAIAPPEKSPMIALGTLIWVLIIDGKRLLMPGRPVT